LSKEGKDDARESARPANRAETFLIESELFHHDDRVADGKMADGASLTQGKMTMGELKQRHVHLREKTKQQKIKIDQYAQNQERLQAAIAERDSAIESRDSFIEECKRVNEESVSRLQSKDFQLAELFHRVYVCATNSNLS
jgi:hypothetical protein